MIDETYSMAIGPNGEELEIGPWDTDLSAIAKKARGFIAQMNVEPMHIQEDFRDRTAVIFRTFPISNSVFALFPYEPGNASLPETCSSFEHVGQHDWASVDVMRITHMAYPAQFAALKRELESAPFYYRLKIITSMPAEAERVRRLKLARKAQA